jgi:hypothetical protein
VLALTQRVQHLEGSVTHLLEAEKGLRKELGEVRAQGQQRAAELERRLSAVARRFEETIDRLTDNQQIISGIKAFLRLIQQGGPGTAPLGAGSPPHE